MLPSTDARLKSISICFSLRCVKPSAWRASFSSFLSMAPFPSLSASLNSCQQSSVISYPQFSPPPAYSTRRGRKPHLFERDLADGGFCRLTKGSNHFRVLLNGLGSDQGDRRLPEHLFRPFDDLHTEALLALIGSSSSPAYAACMLMYATLPQKLLISCTSPTGPKGPFLASLTMLMPHPCAGLRRPSSPAADPDTAGGLNAAVVPRAARTTR